MLAREFTILSNDAIPVDGMHINPRIRDEHGDLMVRDSRGRECPAHFDFVEVIGMRFDREQFDPEKVDGLRTSTEPPVRSLFSLSPEDIASLREEMRRDGQWMRDKLRSKNSHF